MRAVLAEGGAGGWPKWFTPGGGGGFPCKTIYDYEWGKIQEGARIDFYRHEYDRMNVEWAAPLANLPRFRNHIKK